MAVANENAVKYAELTDEHIEDVKKGIELFVKDNEYWDKFANHSVVPRGHKTFTYRRLVKPKVKPEDVAERVEFIAPRPTKIAVETFSKTVHNYGDKAIYSREDMQYHFDNTLSNIKDVLNQIAIQKLDYIKGEPFFKSAATITPIQVGGADSIIKTQEKAAIILRKNGAKRWDGKHYLAHITPEEKAKLVSELEAKGVSLPEAIKVSINGVQMDLNHYGDFIYSETTSDLMYNEDGTQNIVFMGKRGIDGASPIEVAKLEGESGIEVINNPLGSGVLEDVDGKLTSDDNKQQGSVAINMDGLGAEVNDDLCVLDCKFTLDIVDGTNLLETEKAGFVSISGNEVELALVAGSGTTITPDGYARYDTSATKYYGAGSTLVAFTVAATDSDDTLGALTKANWSATYKLASDGDDINAEIVAVTKKAANNDTIIVRVPQGTVYENKLTITCTGTAS